MKTVILLLLLVWWVPIYTYLIIYSIRIRRYVRKNKIQSLESVVPMVIITGKLTSLQLLGESLLYAYAIFGGPILFITLPKKFLTKPILPDS